MSIAEKLYTAEEYLRLPPPPMPTELINGRIVELNLPTPRHGEICINIGILVGGYVRKHQLGRCVGNDSAIVTARDPDTVRGGDVSFFSYDTIPKGPIPNGYLDAIPELVFEVLSTHDRWSNVLAKMSDYFAAGVRAVCVLDPIERVMHIYRPESSPQQLADSDQFAVPDVIGEFTTSVATLLDGE